eukprot:5236059-Prymnesium_polylepis.1
MGALVGARSLTARPAEKELTVEVSCSTTDVIVPIPNLVTTDRGAVVPRIALHLLWANTDNSLT